MNRTLTVSTLAIALVTPATANRIDFALSARVPVQCAVTDVRVIHPASGLVGVEAVCNADSFRLVMGGDLAAQRIANANVTHAQASVTPNAIAVHPDRPGQFNFQISYNADLANISAVTANIELF